MYVTPLYTTVILFRPGTVRPASTRSRSVGAPFRPPAFPVRAARPPLPARPPLLDSAPVLPPSACGVQDGNLSEARWLACRSSTAHRRHR